MTSSVSRYLFNLLYSQINPILPLSFSASIPFLQLLSCRIVMNGGYRWCEPRALLISVISSAHSISFSSIWIWTLVEEVVGDHDTQTCTNRWWSSMQIFSLIVLRVTVLTLKYPRRNAGSINNMRVLPFFAEKIKSYCKRVSGFYQGQVFNFSLKYTITQERER